MKRLYSKPAICVVYIQQQGIVCSTIVRRNSNNVGFNEDIFGGNGTARARSHSYWDDEDDY